MTQLITTLAFGIAASLATLFGGLLALRHADRIAPLLAVSAGIVLGVAFFDLLPEALELAEQTYDARTIMTCASLGLLLYLILGRVLMRAERKVRWAAHLGPASLTLHSLLDGVGVGLAFQISPEVGGWWQWRC